MRATVGGVRLSTMTFECIFFFSSRRRHTRCSRDWSSDVCSSDLVVGDPNLKSDIAGVSTLLDGNPSNNFLKRALTFNPGGILTGARRITIAGTYAYVLTDKALVVVDLDDPLTPQVTATIGAPALNEPRGIAVQFRYAFIVDRDGMKVLDVTDLSQDRKSTRLNSSHGYISYAVFCLKKKKINTSSSSPTFRTASRASFLAVVSRLITWSFFTSCSCRCSRFTAGQS